ncbi:MAG: hypothetical protein NVS1B2_22600 [Vulcanimicrobiaceae bacterium]
MPGYIVHQGATVLCSHAGLATPTALSPAVTVMGMPVVLQTGPYAVAGCTLAAIPSPPCVTGTFVVGSTAVTSYGQPVIVSLGTSICAPTLTPLLVLATQTLVSAL